MLQYQWLIQQIQWLPAKLGLLTALEILKEMIKYKYLSFGHSMN